MIPYHCRLYNNMMYYEVCVLVKFTAIWNALVGYGQYYTLIIPVESGNETFRSKWTYLFGRKIYHANDLFTNKLGC